MLKKAFFQKLREIDFSVKTKQEAVEAIYKEIGNDSEKKGKAVEAIKQAVKEQKEAEAEREAFLKGAYYSKGITEREYIRLINNNVYKVDDDGYFVFNDSVIAYKGDGKVAVR